MCIRDRSVVEANNRLHSLEGEERREIERILLELSDLARPYTAELQNNLDILAYLDLVFAKAALAVQMGAFPGAIHAEGVLDIREGRHPLIDKNLSLIHILMARLEHHMRLARAS